MPDAEAGNASSVSLMSGSTGIDRLSEALADVADDGIVSRSITGPLVVAAVGLCPTGSADMGVVGCAVSARTFPAARRSVHDCGERSGVPQ